MKRYLKTFITSLSLQTHLQLHLHLLLQQLSLPFNRQNAVLHARFHRRARRHRFRTVRC
jgi:hypothetical protein